PRLRGAAAATRAWRARPGVRARQRTRTERTLGATLAASALSRVPLRPFEHGVQRSSCRWLAAVSPAPQWPSGVTSCVSLVSTTNTARSLAGRVLLALALTLWRSPGFSEKLSPAR